MPSYLYSSSLSSLARVVIKVIDICLYPLLSLLPVALPPTLSSLVLPQCYSAYSITPSFLFPFYPHPLNVIVIDLKSHRLYCYYPFNPFTSSSFHPSAYVGCWWDLRRDPSFYHLRITVPFQPQVQWHVTLDNELNLMWLHNGYKLAMNLWQQRAPISKKVLSDVLKRQKINAM
jgi:hypothetical protein